jgi:hypothetical protein
MAITLEYLSYSGAKDNPGGGCRAVFDFQGPDGGALYVGYTFQIGFDYEPKSAVLANNVVVEGLTGVITEVAHETASYATGKLEIYAVQYGTTYNINTFDTSGTPMSDITFTPQSNNSIRAKNLVSGTLADDITTSTTNILVHIADNISAQGITDFFPTAPFYITIMPKSPTIGVANSLDSEIIKITNVDHDQVGNAALTGVRAQRDTTAKAFSTGDIVTVGVYAEDAVFLSEDGTTETESPWVNTNDIVDGSITSEKIANGAVTNTKVSDGAISLNKIDSTTLYNNPSGQGLGNFTLSDTIENYDTIEIYFRNNENLCRSTKFKVNGQTATTTLQIILPGGGTDQAFYISASQVNFSGHNANHYACKGGYFNTYGQMNVGADTDGIKIYKIVGF